MKYRVEMKRRHVAVIFLDRRITSHSKSSWWFSWKSASTRIRSHITLYLFEIKIVIQNDTDNFSQCSNKRLIAHIYRIYRNQVQYWSWLRSLLNRDSKFGLTPTWSFVSTSRLHKGFFSLLDRMVLYLTEWFPKGCQCTLKLQNLHYQIPQIAYSCWIVSNANSQQSYRMK